MAAVEKWSANTHGNFSVVHLWIGSHPILLVHPWYRMQLLIERIAAQAPSHRCARVPPSLVRRATTQLTQEEELMVIENTRTTLTCRVSVHLFSTEQVFSAFKLFLLRFSWKFSFWSQIQPIDTLFFLQHVSEAEMEEAYKLKPATAIPSNLIVNYLPTSINSDEALKALFSPFGGVESCKLMINKHSGESKIQRPFCSAI